MIDVSADFRKLERMLADIPQRQLPFAMSLALNDTAKDVKLAEERQMERKLDRPTPFTKRGVYVRGSTKKSLTVWVGIKDHQAAYLKWQAGGGVRKPKGRALVIGAGLRRNKYGNLPRNAVARAVTKPNTFATKRNGRGKHLAPGIYQRGRKVRGKTKLKLLVAFEPRAKYQPRFPFQATARRTAEGAMQSHLLRRIKQAVETAK